MKVFITHQLDSSHHILDLAPIRNLDSERDVGTIKYKIMEQSSWPYNSKSYVKAKVVDLVELQPKEGFKNITNL